METVTKSVEKNGIAIKGVIAVPEVGLGGDLQNLNQNFRKSLDLYASVVKVQLSNLIFNITGVINDPNGQSHS